jgi:glycolate oxidase iron-sulfur subunit
MDLERARLLADKCVHCGFCLEACPTYKVTRSEVHSPRGRIAAISTGNTGSQGIPTCLVCRRCEEACPSGVEVGEIISSARTPNWTQRVTHRLLEHPWLLYFAIRLAATPIGFGMPRQVAKSVPTPTRPMKHREQQAELVVFAGCVAPVLYPETVRKAVEYLSAFYRISLIQGCCGLAHHSEGETRRATRLLEALAAKAGARPLVCLASNCSAHIKSRSRALGIALEAYDLPEFLEAKRLPVKPRQLRLTVHEPCHARLAGLNEYTISVLGRMGVEVVHMSDPTLECGAAGAYIFEQPTLSAQIMDAKKREVESTGCDIVVSTNFACSIALANMGFRPLHIADLL